MTSITIIVPVYNTENYIETCLKSLISQNLDNFEIICINDGSTDNSFDILNKYAKHYGNIKILSQQNQGVSIARNNGLKIAKGDYVMFVDSDDWIEKNSLKIFIMQLFHPNLIFYFTDMIVKLMKKR